MPEWLEQAEWYQRVQESPWYEWLSARQWYGNSLWLWAVALVLFLLLALILRLAKAIIVQRARKVAERLDHEWAKAVVEMLHHTKLLFLLILAFSFSCWLVLDLPQKGETALASVTIIALLIQGAIWGTTLLVSAINHYAKRRMETDPASVTLVKAMGFLGKVAIWTVAALLTLDNLGIEVTALIAGLGVGGIAIGLAAQNILGDLFASFSIVLDKPFVLGDFILVGDLMGNVEHIGLKTTRLRSLSGEQLVFSNNDLLQSRIRNYKRMLERRIAFTFGVTYQTPYEKLATVPQMVREIVEQQQQARFDRSHFKQYGDSALIFENVYYVLVPDFDVYMDVQQAINLGLYQRFEQEGIAFAYPTQTLYVQKMI